VAAWPRRRRLDDILDIWRTPRAAIGFSLFIVLLLAGIGFVMWVERDFAAGRMSEAAPRFRATLFVRAAVAGLFSGFVGSFSKAVVSVFSASVADGAAGNLNRWEPWILLVCLPAALVCQVLYLNSALRRFAASEAVPLYQSMVVVAGLMFGWVIFNEAAGKSGGAIVGVVCGFLLIVAGILSLLVRKRVGSLTTAVSLLPLAPALALAARVGYERRAVSEPPSLRPRCRPARLAFSPDDCMDAWDRRLNFLRQRLPRVGAGGACVDDVLAIDRVTLGPVSMVALIRAAKRAAPLRSRQSSGAGARAEADAARAHAPLLPPGHRPPSLLTDVDILVPATMVVSTERAADARVRHAAAVAGEAALVQPELPSDLLDWGEVQQQMTMAPLPFMFELPDPASSASLLAGNAIPLGGVVSSSDTLSLAAQQPRKIPRVYHSLRRMLSPTSLAAVAANMRIHSLSPPGPGAGWHAPELPDRGATPSVALAATPPTSAAVPHASPPHPAAGAAGAVDERAASRPRGRASSRGRSHRHAATEVGAGGAFPLAPRGAGRPGDTAAAALAGTAAGAGKPAAPPMAISGWYRGVVSADAALATSARVMGRGGLTPLPSGGGSDGAAPRLAGGTREASVPVPVMVATGRMPTAAAAHKAAPVVQRQRSRPLASPVAHGRGGGLRGFLASPLAGRGAHDKRDGAAGRSDNVEDVIASLLLLPACVWQHVQFDQDVLSALLRRPARHQWQRFPPLPSHLRHAQLMPHAHGKPPAQHGGGVGAAAFTTTAVLSHPLVAGAEESKSTHPVTIPAMSARAGSWLAVPVPPTSAVRGPVGGLSPTATVVVVAEGHPPSAHPGGAAAPSVRPPAAAPLALRQRRPSVVLARAPADAEPMPKADGSRPASDVAGDAADARGRPQGGGHVHAAGEVQRLVISLPQVPAGDAAQSGGDVTTPMRDSGGRSESPVLMGAALARGAPGGEPMNAAIAPAGASTTGAPYVRQLHSLEVSLSVTDGEGSGDGSGEGSHEWQREPVSQTSGAGRRDGVRPGDRHPLGRGGGKSAAAATTADLETAPGAVTVLSVLMPAHATGERVPPAGAVGTPALATLAGPALHPRGHGE
jgi:hypothetical protein